MFPPRIPTSSVVKNTIAASLKGRRAPALLASLCCVFACLICSLINSVLSIAFVGSFSFVPYIFGAVLSFFVLMPLFLGTVRYFWRFTDGAEDSPSEVFFYFSSFSLYKRAISCVFAVGLRCAVVVILCLLPYIAVSLFCEGWIFRFLGAEMPIWAQGLVLVQGFLLVAGSLGGGLLALRYYLFSAVVVMDDEIHPLEALRISSMVARQSQGSFLELLFSLLGWILLSFLLVPLFYTAPLFFGCYAVHCRYAIVNYNESLKAYSDDNFTPYI